MDALRAPTQALTRASLTDGKSRFHMNGILLRQSRILQFFSVMHRMNHTFLGMVFRILFCLSSHASCHILLVCVCVLFFILSVLPAEVAAVYTFTYMQHTCTHCFFLTLLCYILTSVTLTFPGSLRHCSCVQTPRNVT